MADVDERTLKEKALFYTTAFFILLATFSLFGFLFLVPFVIEPAFTTIFMQFDERPAYCVTSETIEMKGASNCSWTSCKEGCTKDIYKCTQIRVNYKIFKNESMLNESTSSVASFEPDQPAGGARVERAIRDYNYLDSDANANIDGPEDVAEDFSMDYNEPLTGLMGNRSEWYFIGARLFPNVKGCGYPPSLNCTIWEKKFKEEGSNFSCYYSRVDPGIVISDLDLWQNTLNLVYSIAIPIPSFIISVIYLTIAYFKIYNEDEENVPLDKNAEEIADDAIEGGEENELNEDGTEKSIKEGPATDNTQIANGTAVTPNSIDGNNSFGHQLKVKMADEMSRDSIEGGLISNSASAHG